MGTVHGIGTATVSSTPSHTTSRPLSDRLGSLMDGPTQRPMVALPSRLCLSASRMSPAPLLRYPSHGSTHSVESSSRPPTPLATALSEALSESILPAPPPQARLPPALSPFRALTRPPLMATVRCTYPTASLLAAHGSFSSSVSSIQPSSPSLIAPGRISPRVTSSLDALRSIHTSSSAYFTSFQSQSKWWFQLDSDTVKKASTESILLEDGSENTTKKCT